MKTTYSPEDNKLRLYSSERLPKETYDRLRKAGFAWAPKQKLFYATWTPGREDLLTEFAEIGDEDISLVERAEERAERFEGYADKRGDEARRLKDSLNVSDVVAGASMLQANKAAKKLEKGLKRAVRLWETSTYWERRAKSALQHAKYKESAGTRFRRIKGLEADARKFSKEIGLAETWLKHWAGANQEKAKRIADVDGSNTWSGLNCGELTLEQAKEQAAKRHGATIEHYRRWLNHTENRLRYENAMLGESGGIVADKFDLKVGGTIHAYDYLLTILKLNKSGGRIVSVTTNNTRWPRIVQVEAIEDYTPPAEDVAKIAEKAAKAPPLCNYKGEGFIEITQEEWDAAKGRRGFRRCDGHRVREVRWATLNKLGKTIPHREGFAAHLYMEPVFITDAKVKAPSKLEPVELPPVRQVMPAPRLSAPAQPADEFATMRETLKKGVKVVAAPQLFPTPPEIAAEMVKEAAIETGHRILEPSAGTGNLLKALTENDSVPPIRPDGSVVAVEIQQSLIPFLTPWADEVRCTDFLECEDLGQFDRVLMNPPFHNGEDIKHIKHALKLLKPGGRLVALCANGPRQHAELSSLGEYRPLPAGSFHSSGTNVNVAMLVVRA